MIPVVDLFAGPGGLGEGFACYERYGQREFAVVLSIEMEVNAFRTLMLRTFLREFETPPLQYYDVLARRSKLDGLYHAFPKQAQASGDKAWCAKLGPGGVSLRQIRTRIRKSLKSADRWVLIGGPPCQAYSLAGRGRNAGNPSYKADEDERQTLYVEYLQVLADHGPPVFVMENVKGLLSATVKDEAIFARIVSDLRDPAAALRREGRGTLARSRPQYSVFSLVTGHEVEDGNLRSSLVQAEQYGVPQARHRVILLGVRCDHRVKSISPLRRATAPVPVHSVLFDLPPLRSGVTGSRDSTTRWLDSIRQIAGETWLAAVARQERGAEVVDTISNVIASLAEPPAARGGEYMPGRTVPCYRPRWYTDSRLSGLTHHASRAHMYTDLCRYLYAACYAVVHGYSPKLRHFPQELWPKHKSVARSIERGGNYEDRFRVQTADDPSGTVMSHISKDGHYYIHPDPRQCRSLTVREAARLQTFPDNYFFAGCRTAQYVQVGNAVPPLLSRQIAEVVARVLQ